MANEYYISACIIPIDNSSGATANSYYISAGIVPDDLAVGTTTTTTAAPTTTTTAAPTTTTTAAPTTTTTAAPTTTTTAAPTTTTTTAAPTTTTTAAPTTTTTAAPTTTTTAAPTTTTTAAPTTTEPPSEAVASTIGNPYSVTGGAVSSSLKITDEIVTIQKIIWYGVTTAGHLASLTSKEALPLWKMSADTPGASGILTYQSDFTKGLPATGIYCDDMDSGELYVYVR